MNELLKLLGEYYELYLNYTPKKKEYNVTVGLNDDAYVTKSFSALEAETLGFNILITTVEKCVLELQTFPKWKKRSNNLDITRKRSANRL
jgi:hypothetical protein